MGKEIAEIRQRSRSRSGFSRRSLSALLGACGTRVPDHWRSNGANRLLLVSPFDQFRLRQPRRQEVPSKDGSRRLNLQWSLRPFPDLFGAAYTKWKRTKKRRKDKEKRKNRFRTSGSDEYSRRVRLIKNANRYPLHECLINDAWQDQGLAQILLSRKQPNGNLVFGVYLIDIYCLGLKNTFCNADISLAEYQVLNFTTFKEMILIPCSPGKARRIIFGAIEYARKLGFEPQKDFALSRFLLEGLPDEADDFALEFGKHQKPLYIAGPDDDFETIIKTLMLNVGTGWSNL